MNTGRNSRETTEIGKIISGVAVVDAAEDVEADAVADAEVEAVTVIKEAAAVAKTRTNPPSKKSKPNELHRLYSLFRLARIFFPTVLSTAAWTLQHKNEPSAIRHSKSGITSLRVAL